LPCRFGTSRDFDPVFEAHLFFFPFLDSSSERLKPVDEGVQYDAGGWLNAKIPVFLHFLSYGVRSSAPIPHSAPKRLDIAGLFSFFGLSAVRFVRKYYQPPSFRHLPFRAPTPL